MLQSVTHESTTHAAKTQVRNLFFALQPGDSVAMQLTRAAQQARAAKLFTGDGRPVHTHHLTLHFLGAHVVGMHGEFPAGLVLDAMAAANSVAFPPFEFIIDRIERLGRGERVPCVLRSAQGSDAALRLFHETIGAAMRVAGLSCYLERRQFAPHVTLAYSGSEAEPLALAEPITWSVREFVLLESHVGRSLHNRLGAWPLA